MFKKIKPITNAIKIDIHEFCSLILRILVSPTPKKISCDKKKSRLAKPLCPIFLFIIIFSFY